MCREMKSVELKTERKERGSEREREESERWVRSNWNFHV